MKISFLIYSYFPYGGQQRDFLRIINACLSRGHEIDVYTMKWQGELPEALNLITVPVKAMSKTKLYRCFTQWVEKALSRQMPHPVFGFNKMPLLDLYFAADPCFAEKADTQRGAY
jgi:UDP-glucose:(heptosyl)LPS alpha-1,3-glucosyltransferase